MRDDLLVHILNGDTSDLYETELGYLFRWISSRSMMQALSLKAGLMRATSDPFLPQLQGAIHPRPLGGPGVLGFVG
jgi:hypothetical protein